MITICHVLIIEDEPFFAMDLQSILETEGATSFDFADSHLDAVGAAQARRPAIITSDVHLFDGKGPAAVAAIRALLGPIPVIFITATPQDCGAMPVGGALLSKPLNHDALRVEFRKLMQ